MFATLCIMKWIYFRGDCICQIQSFECTDHRSANQLLILVGQLLRIRQHRHCVTKGLSSVEVVTMLDWRNGVC